MVRVPSTIFAVAVLVPTLAFAAPPLPQGFDTTCVEDLLTQCEVTASGFASFGEGMDIAFQIQTGASDELGLGAAVVLYESRDDKWALLAAENSGVLYRIPRLIEGDEMIIHVPGFMQGTGSFNADVVFVRGYDEDSWQRFDIDSWFDAVSPMLPDGLGIWKGVDFDFGDWYWTNYLARTPLWKDDDANCCPTGGWAEIELEIEDGRLMPIKVNYREEIPE